MEFVDNHVEIEPPKNPKRLTATRFAAVLGMNRWATPFQVWCNVTRTWESEFEESRYTVAGQVIEDKVINYLNDVYFMDLKRPADVYGEDYFKKTHGNFFPDVPIFGGMWDALGDGFVVEIKTTKRAEDWADGIPVYYKLQAALYAYLLGFDDVTVTVTFLNESDYPTQMDDGTWDTAATKAFEPSVGNTKLIQFSMREEFPDFEDNYITPAQLWWHRHVETGVSPDYDERRDAEPLKSLRKATWEPDDEETISLMREADVLKAEIDSANEKLAEHVARLKEIDAIVKKALAGRIQEGGRSVESVAQGGAYVWTVSARAGKASFDTAAFQRDHPDLYGQYVKTGKTTFALTKKPIV